MGNVCCRSRKRNRPNNDTWVAKENITLWDFQRGKDPNKIQCSKGDHFILKRRARDSVYADKSFYWQFKQDTPMGATGYACRFYFYPLNYKIPEETSLWYFGSLERQEADELLTHKQNGDGAYLVRYSNNKRSFVLSIKYMSETLNNWSTSHYNVMRTDPDNNKGQFFFEQHLLFHQMEDLLNKYKEEGQKRFPTHLTNVCFVPDPLVDPRFAQDIGENVQENLWLINRLEIRDLKEIGRGNFGVVSSGKWRDTDVAVKELLGMDKAGSYTDTTGGQGGGYNQEDKYEKEKKNFMKEMDIMKKLHHPNLVKMYGICVDKLPFYIILEHCKKGDLKKHLESFKQGTGELIRGKRTVPTFIQLLQWCKEIAAGMRYLENEELVHRDLAARNVLLDRNGVAKVADFGLSKGKGEATDNEAFPILWSPPEVLSRREFSSKSDVWSFGITMWEIFSFGEKPYNGMKHNDLKNFLKREERIAVPAPYLKEPPNAKEIVKKVYDEIMWKCWMKKPEDRPTFTELGSLITAEIKRRDVEYF